MHLFLAILNFFGGLTQFYLFYVTASILIDSGKGLLVLPLFFAYTITAAFIWFVAYAEYEKHKESLY